MPQALKGRVRFGPFELDLRAGELHCNGQRTVLPEQQFKVLLMLVEQEAEIATREEIKKRLWPNDTIVEFDYGINNTVKNLRRALNDSAQNPHYIETIPRRGYRLMVPVEWVELGGGFFCRGILPDSSSSDDSEDSDAVSSRAKRSGVEGSAVDDSKLFPGRSSKSGGLPARSRRTTACWRSSAAEVWA